MDPQASKSVLQLATYMCPSVPVEYYELLCSYLETQIGMQTSLLYNSRRFGPDSSRDLNHIDLAFVPTTTYLEEYAGPDSSFQLLPAGAVSQHPLKGEVLGYYTDIILHRDTKERVKEFSDIRGCSFAYSHESSISSAKQVLLTLKQSGENASFFSNVEACGNHYAAIESVLAKKTECAAVSSISLSNYLRHHYYLAPELHLQESLGPLPAEPILVNKALPGTIVDCIQEALLRMHKTQTWKEQLGKFSISRFEATSADRYYEATELLNSTKSLSLGVMYY